MLESKFYSTCQHSLRRSSGPGSRSRWRRDSSSGCCRRSSRRFSSPRSSRTSSIRSSSGSRATACRAPWPSCWCCCAPWLKARLDLDVRLDAENATQLGKQILSDNEQLAKHLLASLKTGGMVLITILADLVLVPVVLFYLLRDWNLLLDRVDVLIPRNVHAKARAMAARPDPRHRHHERLLRARVMAGGAGVRAADRHPDRPRGHRSLRRDRDRADPRDTHRVDAIQ